MVQNRVQDFLRQDTTCKNIVFFNALVSFEILGYLAFHNVLFSMEGQITQN